MSLTMCRQHLIEQDISKTFNFLFIPYSLDFEQVPCNLEHCMQCSTLSNIEFGGRHLLKLRKFTPSLCFLEWAYLKVSVSTKQTKQNLRSNHTP